MDPDSVSYIGMMSEIGSTGMLGWILHQVFRKTVPGLQEDFKEALIRQQEAHEESLVRMQAAHEESLTRQQESNDRGRLEFMTALLTVDRNMDRLSARIEKLTIAVAHASGVDPT